MGQQKTADVAILASGLLAIVFLGKGWIFSAAGGAILAVVGELVWVCRTNGDLRGRWYTVRAHVYAGLVGLGVIAWLLTELVGS